MARDGNEWEKKVAKVCEGLAADGLITSYVKNDQLGFSIPYVHKGRSHQYWPDFLLKITPQASEDAADPTMERFLIVEVSGSQKSPGPTKGKGPHRTRQLVRCCKQPRWFRSVGLHRVGQGRGG